MPGGSARSDTTQLARLADAGICHGWAGTHQTAWRATRDETPTSEWDACL
ncbi:hypothetical protein [Streptomyces sp. NPDC047315]